MSNNNGVAFVRPNYVARGTFESSHTSARKHVQMIGTRRAIHARMTGAFVNLCTTARQCIYVGSCYMNFK